MDKLIQIAITLVTFSLEALITLCGVVLQFLIFLIPVICIESYFRKIPLRKTKTAKIPWKISRLFVQLFSAVASKVFPNQQIWFESLVDKHDKAEYRWINQAETQAQKKQQEIARLDEEARSLGSMHVASTSKIADVFQNTELWNAWMRQRLSEASKTGEIKLIDLREVFLIGTSPGKDLRGTDFRQVEIISSLLLEDCNLSGANFSGIKSKVHFSSCDFAMADLSNIDWESANFFNCDFTNTTLSKANLKKASFYNCIFKGVLFDSVNLCSSHFHDSFHYETEGKVFKTSKCLFNTNKFINCHFTESNLSQSCFDSSTKFVGTLFSKCDTRRAKIDGDLDGCEFHETRIPS